MPRLDRLTAILIHLQTKRVVKAQELADRFNVSLRTIYRDVRSLEEAGVPVGAEAGVGYFLENYHLPPVMFTDTEASALLFGAKLVDRYTDGSVREAFDSALYKIKSVLKRGGKEHLDDLEGQIAVQRSTTIIAPTDNAVLSTIQTAIVARHRLRIVYQRLYAEQDTERDVEPIGLIHYGIGWHLIAWCTLRRAYRDFRTDRIVRLLDTGDAFAARDRLSLDEYLNTLSFTAKLSEIRVCFTLRMALHAQTQRFWYGYVDEERRGDQVCMRFLAMAPEALCRWLLMFGDQVHIESPPELMSLMQTLAQAAAAHWTEKRTP